MILMMIYAYSVYTNPVTTLGLSMMLYRYSSSL